jgi:tellurium resistance protein TerD
VKVQCLKCHSEFEVPEHYIGKEIKCIKPKCGNCFIARLPAPPTPTPVIDIEPAQPEPETDLIRCPKCKSTQIMGSQKGYSGGRAVIWTALLGPVGLFTGLIGSKKVKVSCLKCGFQWEPQEQSKTEVG